ncbi:squalene monooxygenase [Rhizoctonia solani AG-3 Rhs1AP]|uniref:Squalene monooxygenase n=2 Tax=Rhizoctonia solani AG-3 TaxID=1086053 RepID=A0A074RJD0_9AGAM|nr:squalene monooxygenase [Rhizoctonia solani AG-3 Rhs1AP]KEP46924.1 squalene monooxygenase [Rhizoctonia solani 123E]
MSEYDVVVIGAGVAGSAMAHALATMEVVRPLKIALVERSLAEPDRIVGELLQPGGMDALKKLGLQDTTEDIDAIPVHGYAVLNAGSTVHIPYPGTAEGRSFHHGRFVMRLREAAMKHSNVETIEAVVSDLVEENGKIAGIRARRKDRDEEETFSAGLTIVADGCFSKFRNRVLRPSALKPQTRSHFVGAVLKDARLPIPQHGTVALTTNGPVLLYQIGEHDTRMLVDVKGASLPRDLAVRHWIFPPLITLLTFLQGYVRQNVIPELPPALRAPIEAAISSERLRSMPNSFLPPSQQGSSHHPPGVLLLGDSWNMRHPLTGGGMTVAFSDVVILQRLLTEYLASRGPDIHEGVKSTWSEWDELAGLLRKWHWERKSLASTVNILSVALYDLFGANDENLHVLRTGCFKYFERGGECVNGPVSLLSALAPRPGLLMYHFFSVAFYSIWILFTQPKPKVIPYPEDVRPGNTTPSDSVEENKAPSLGDYPRLFAQSFAVFWTACIVFGPLLWSEIRWW